LVPSSVDFQLTVADPCLYAGIATAPPITRSQQVSLDPGDGKLNEAHKRNAYSHGDEATNPSIYEVPTFCKKLYE
jgi:hypothetical protein